MNPVAWRYDIQYGPDGEANYAWVYNDKGEMVCTTKTHHAIAIVDRFNSASELERRNRELMSSLSMMCGDA